MTDTYYITTSIPYVNAKPHMGFALEIVQTDALARYHRLRGDDVWFLTGTDENSLSNIQAAVKEGIPTKQLVDRNAPFFRALKEQLGLSFDDFIRTADEDRHLDGARKLWEACDANGDIYVKDYEGLYCIGCERFYEPEELTEGLCPEHQTAPELVSEENYFFRLTRYADELERLITSEQLRVVPQTRRNEVLSLIRMGLRDISISRSKERSQGWGVPVPGDEEQVMYVWFDALSNYINALGYSQTSERYEHYWVNNPNRVHVIGKDISRFHAVYWPAMLLSAGIALPKIIYVHGWINLDGQALSKSRGIVLDPVEIAANFGIDPLRYYLLRKISSWSDSNFSFDHLVQTYNSDLADQLGNLLSRVVAMVTKYFDGLVPGPTGDLPADMKLKSKASGLAERIDESMDAFLPGDALAAVWELIAEANRYVVENEPWNLAKRRAEDQLSEGRLATVLYNLIETLRIVSWGCAPFIPATAAAIASQLGIPAPTTGNLSEVFAWGGYPSGTPLAPAAVLFPKLEV
ncbi:MAG: methionine--tRNA ligase [Actinomycetota bacterium]